MHTNNLLKTPVILIYSVTAFICWQVEYIYIYIFSFTYMIRIHWDWYIHISYGTGTFECYENILQMLAVLVSNMIAGQYAIAYEIITVVSAKIWTIVIDILYHLLNKAHLKLLNSKQCLKILKPYAKLIDFWIIFSQKLYDNSEDILRWCKFFRYSNVHPVRARLRHKALFEM